MFALPDAKRVKRSKLFSSFTSSDSEREDKDEDSGTTRRRSGSREGKSKSTLNNPESHQLPGIQHNIDGTQRGEQVNYGFDYEFVDKSQPRSTSKSQSDHDRKGTGQAEDDDDKNTVTASADTTEQSYAFNLFAPKPKPKPKTEPDANAVPDPDDTTTTTTTTIAHSTQQARITIRSPTPPTTLDPHLSGRILKPRPQTHYFTSALSPQIQSRLQAQYLACAVTGTHIQTQSTTTAWPGTSLPWRVISIPRRDLKFLGGGGEEGGGPNNGGRGRGGCEPQPKDDRTRSRPRPSKKRRVQVRRRREARRAVVEAGVVAEAAEREKRTRRNREKKVKRKIREKAKKMDAKGDVDGGEERE